MAKQKPFITDQQWIRLEPLRPKPKPSAKGGPKPRGNRQVFDGIIWVLPTGPGWNHLADRYPSASTCRPRLQPWEEQGVRVDKKPDNGHYQQSFMIKIIKGRNQSGSGLHISVIAKISPWALIVLVEKNPPEPRLAQAGQKY